MRKLFFPACIAVCLVAGLYSCEDKKTENTATSGDTTKMAESTTTSEEAWVPVDSATAMKSMMEAGTPGAEHAMLAKGAGSWTADVSMYMDPAAPPMKSTGMEVSKMSMDGRYMESSFSGDMMGMPFMGRAITGYDKSKKKWFNVWYDNMSTGAMYLEGTWDDATKTTTYEGEMMCPANGKMCKVRQTYKIVDDNTHMLEMYGPDMKTGKEVKQMEITYKKKA